MVRNANHPERSSPSLTVDEELSRVLRSTPFQGTRQCQTLLKYLVEKSLNGQGDLLKERTIGMEVFGRKPDYNTAEDPIVRARVGEVRKRLAQYYQSDEARGSAVQIVISSGSYRPTFISHPGTNGERIGTPLESQSQTAPHHATEEPLEPVAAFPATSAVPGSSRVPYWRVWRVVVPVACAVLLAAWAGFVNWPKSEFDLFWGPIFENKKTVVVYMGTAPLYVSTAAFGEKMRSLIPPDEQKLPMTEWRPPPLVEGQTLTARDVQLNLIDNVAVDDVTAVVDVAELLTAHHRSLDLRSGSNLPYEDLRGAPVVLTGAASNYWAIDMTRDLPFFIDRGLRIRERGGQGQVWSTPLWLPHKITDDYAIVSRLLDSKTGTTIVILAGINSCGTRAAGEFVTDSAQMKKLGSVPRDALRRKNLEFVLHTTLVDCNPASMDVVAQRYW